jgi:hypothetical protein
MAYAATSTVTKTKRGGKTYWIISIVETGLVDTTNEYRITGLPEILQVVAVSSVLTVGGGTATQVDPQLGDLTNTNNVFENTTASASTNEYPTAAISSNLTGSMFWRAKCNGTTSGAGAGVKSRVVFVEGLK